MKGDFSRFTFDPRKRYTRVLKQQGRVDLDADWNEAVEILTRRDRTEAIDVIGRCGVPTHGGGFKVESTPDGDGLTVTPGRIWVDGILCDREGEDPVPLTGQEDLPGYELPDDDGVYLVYVDVWDRHITHLEDPEIREPALGGPDTTTRTRTVCQVRLHRIGDDEPLELHECQPFPADPSTGRLAADAATPGAPTNPCAVPEGAGYTGLENRLYRVEIHDDGRAEDGTPGARPVTWKWSRDNGSVVLPVAEENGIDGDTVTLQRLGHDEVLTVKVGDWVEVLGDETELHRRPGTLGQIVPDGIDRADLEVELDTDVSAHAVEGHLKVRRWDHQETEDLELIDGALPLPTGPFELEDGVIVEFEPGGSYHTGDYWVIPARTREGTVLWPREGEPAASVSVPPLGITHHYCTLALARRTGGEWREPRDCRPLFPPLTEVNGGGCCVTVDAGEDIQQALDTVVAAGGGCVALCEGVHVVNGPLWIRDGADIMLHGVAAATVVRFQGTADDGTGGLVIENGRRVAVQDLFLASDSVPALVTVRHGPELEPSRQIALRRLLMLNLTASDRESSFACGVRLGHADGVTFDECRIAAEVGIVSLWGNALPELPEQEDDTPAAEEGGAVPGVVHLQFEGLEAGAEFDVGESFSEAGIAATAGPFENASGNTIESGVVRVDTRSRAGGTGQDLQLSQASLAFDLPGSFAATLVTFGELGGNVNLRVNGDQRNVADVLDLDGAVVGGVRVSVAMVGGDRAHGQLRLDADSSRIEDLAIGGAELWIDDVVFRGGASPGEAVLAYGDGVRDLRMRDTAIRFRDGGILAARAEAWQIDRADIRPYGEEAWAEAGERFRSEAEPRDPDDFSPEEHVLAGAGGRALHTAVLGALEEVFAAPGPLRGYGLLAFRWEGCAVRDSDVSGRHGLQAWWWLGGETRSNELRVADSGLHAFWLYESTWDGNTVSVQDGLALSVAGCCRVRLEDNRLRGPVGVANLPFQAALDGLEALGQALLRGYGTDTATETAILMGIAVDESFGLMGLNPLMEALQPILDEASPYPGVPVAWYWASSILTGLRGSALPMPLIDLAVSHNDVACDQCITFNDYLPLGGLRVTENRLHTTTGQAVRVQTNPYLANAHLVVFLFRFLLDRLREMVEEAASGAQEPLDALWDALAELLERWQAGVESLFDLDFRVEGNTIRSLRTAVESNLFELAVLTNHITLQEREVARAPEENTGAIFGVVTTPDGGSIVQAAVRVVGTDRVAFTDQKAEYRLDGLPPGSYTLRATRAGYTAATASATLAPGEQVELDFVLVALSGRIPLEHEMAVEHEMVMEHELAMERVGFGDAVVGTAALAGMGSNPEILEVMEALESSVALEPLAVALREGGHTMPEAYAAYLAADNGPLVSSEDRGAAADAVTLVGGQSSHPEMRQVAGQLNTALRANDRSAFTPLLTRFIRALQRYTDSQGILVKGVGGRIVENQVVVPADALEDTEALGGIQVSVNYAHIFLMAFLGSILARYIGGDDDDEVEIDPLLGITDTLVDTNEVVGGVGHGISVQGVAGQPDFVSDLRIRGNQVRGMAGAGIYINEHALVVGLEAADNHVSGCGRDAGFTQSKGGLLVQAAAVCDVRGNHVLRCGAALEGANAYGVDLDSLYGLRFAGNAVQANGAGSATAEDGGVRLVEVYGATQLHDNVVAFNRGLGLSWVNSARQDEDALLPGFLMGAVNLYLRTSRDVSQLVEEEQASIQQNIFKSVADSDLPVFQLLNLREVLFSGNSSHGETTGAPLGEIQQTARGVVTNNQTQTNGEVAIAIKKMSDGVVLGNVGNQPIQLQSSAGVERAYNVPPVT